MYEVQLKNNMQRLTSILFELYGNRWDFYQILDEVVALMSKANKERNASLKKSDEKYLAEDIKDRWYLKSDTVGMMLYVDLFSTDLKKLVDNVDYFKSLGVNYIHLMPLFACPEDDSDGGYAISSYRKVQPSLGTIEDLKEVAKVFHKNNIKLVLDFVFNHTSEEHEWALKAKQGDAEFQNYYYMFEDKKEVDEWNSTLREIFPTVRRGSFTYYEKLNKWVWTTFNSFQWDLNYSNPKVFIAMCKEMLSIANLGVDVIRLDALAFVWKQKYTVCESLDNAHKLISAFECVAEIAAPGLQFKSEAIVHPDQVIKYINNKECRLSYNPLQMALFWSTLATRDTRLLTLSLKKRWHIDNDCAWINYIRCHDDIGWTFSDEDAASLGINGYDHRLFLNKFYTNRFAGSFASGEPFQLNPSTGDCRICGTMASLAGLEQAETISNALYKEMALKRMEMIYGVLMALPGIPLLYAGDENAVFNDYSYRDDSSKSYDSRWVHRIARDKNPEESLTCEQKEFNAYLKKIIKLRGKTTKFGGNDIEFYDIQDSRVFAFRRQNINVVANFSESIASFSLGYAAQSGKDIITGQVFDNCQNLVLQPYQILWLES